MSSSPYNSEWTREEKDNYAKECWEKMREKNEKIKKRFEEVEKDRKSAEQTNSSVTNELQISQIRTRHPSEEVNKEPAKVEYTREWDKGKIQDKDWIIIDPSFPQHFKSRKDWNDNKTHNYSRKSNDGSRQFNRQFDNDDQKPFVHKREFRSFTNSKNRDEWKSSRGRGYKSAVRKYSPSRSKSNLNETQQSSFSHKSNSSYSTLSIKNKLSHDASYSNPNWKEIDRKNKVENWVMNNSFESNEVPNTSYYYNKNSSERTKIKSSANFHDHKKGFHQARQISREPPHLNIKRQFSEKWSDESAYKKDKYIDDPGIKENNMKKNYAINNNQNFHDSEINDNKPKEFQIDTQKSSRKSLMTNLPGKIKNPDDSHDHKFDVKQKSFPEMWVEYRNSNEYKVKKNKCNQRHSTIDHSDYRQANSYGKSHAKISNSWSDDDDEDLESKKHIQSLSDWVEPNNQKHVKSSMWADDELKNKTYGKISSGRSNNECKNKIDQKFSSICSDDDLYEWPKDDEPKNIVDVKISSEYHDNKTKIKSCSSGWSDEDEPKKLSFHKSTSGWSDDDEPKKLSFHKSSSGWSDEDEPKRKTFQKSLSRSHDKPKNQSFQKKCSAGANGSKKSKKHSTSWSDDDEPANKTFENFSNNTYNNNPLKALSRFSSNDEVNNNQLKNKLCINTPIVESKGINSKSHIKSKDPVNFSHNWYDYEDSIKNQIKTSSFYSDDDRPTINQSQVKAFNGLYVNNKPNKNQIKINKIYSCNKSKTQNKLNTHISWSDDDSIQHMKNFDLSYNKSQGKFKKYAKNSSSLSDNDEPIRKYNSFDCNQDYYEICVPGATVIPVDNAIKFDCIKDMPACSENMQVNPLDFHVKSETCSDVQLSNENYQKICDNNQDSNKKNSGDDQDNSNQNIEKKLDNFCFNSHDDSKNICKENLEKSDIDEIKWGKTFDNSSSINLITNEEEMSILLNPNVNELELKNLNEQQHQDRKQFNDQVILLGENNTNSDLNESVNIVYSQKVSIVNDSNINNSDKIVDFLPCTDTNNLDDDNVIIHSNKSDSITNFYNEDNCDILSNTRKSEDVNYKNSNTYEYKDEHFPETCIVNVAGLAESSVRNNALETFNTPIINETTSLLDYTKFPDDLSFKTNIDTDKPNSHNSLNANTNLKLNVKPETNVDEMSSEIMGSNLSQDVSCFAESNAEDTIFLETTNATSVKNETISLLEDCTTFPDDLSCKTNIDAEKRDFHNCVVANKNLKANVKTEANFEDMNSEAIGSKSLSQDNISTNVEDNLNLAISSDSSILDNKFPISNDAFAANEIPYISSNEPLESICANLEHFASNSSNFSTDIDSSTNSIVSLFKEDLLMPSQNSSDSIMPHGELEQNNDPVKDIEVLGHKSDDSS